MSELLCPTCPLCDSPPAFSIGDYTQAFCGNNDCKVLCWNMRVTREDNLLSTERQA